MKPLTAPQLDLLDLLRCRFWTIPDLAKHTQTAPESVRMAIRRLREHGVPVLSMDADDLAARQRGNQPLLYTVRWPAGRVCAVDGCSTILRTTNPSSRCELHGGGAVPDELQRPEKVLLERARRCTKCGHTTVDFAPGKTVCRPCWNAYRMAYKARRKEAMTA